MRAMILAAGHGKRLAPLTYTLPKALVQVGGKSLLEILLRRLEAQGFTQIAVNLHYRSEQVQEFLAAYRTTTRARIYLSHETELLDTGGGIKKMCGFFPGDEPVLVHNVDVLSDCRLDELMLQFEHVPSCDALLVVLDRTSERPLCFDQTMNFQGRGEHEETTSCRHYAFTGIQVVKPSLFRECREEKFYSIDFYAKAAAAGRIIKGIVFSGTFWQDVGTAEDLLAAERNTAFLETNL